jgi:pheromone shutdown protein TraB
LLTEEFPEVANALIHDRDKAMWKSLQQMASEPSGARRRVVVGVVGFAHLDGIERQYRIADGQTKIASNDEPKQLPPPDVIHL